MGLKLAYRYVLFIPGLETPVGKIRYAVKRSNIQPSIQTFKLSQLFYNISMMGSVMSTKIFYYRNLRVRSYDTLA